MKEKGRPAADFLRQLSKAQLVESQLGGGCQMRWRREGERYMGEIKPGDCIIDSKYQDEKRQLFAEEVVFKEGVWMREGAYRLDGSLAFGLEAGNFYEYKRLP